jgi:ABC-type dipeptide/oligopeptide/nickel transport system ATPase component
LLALTGEAGSAKSTAAKTLRRLIDPNASALRSAPRDERDLFIAASNAACLIYDNLSSIPPWLSDALCRVATGGGFATRALHTDSEEALFEVARPVCLTSVGDVIARSDLANRTI